MTLKSYGELCPPVRLLLGAGPSNVHPRVLKALLSPIVAHLDPYFMSVMDETVDLLRYAFKTKNHITLPISGTGSAGMESAVCNIVERGDEVVILVNGFFSERIRKMVVRCGGKPVIVKAEWGQVFEKEDVERVLSESKAKSIMLVQVETSTGVLQPIPDIANVARDYGALLVVDAVASLGGCKIDVDQYGIDVCYSASQKCLSCPPGLAPITASEKAMEHIRNRKSPVQSWYLDLSTIEKYWIERNRAYHHTAPILLVYALREGLRLLNEEGLESVWLRHRKNSTALINGLEALGLTIFGKKESLSPTITPVVVPKKVSDAKVRTAFLEQFGITVSGGLGNLRGKLLRIGLMGMNSTERNVVLVLNALEHTFRKENFPLELGTSIAAAMKTLSD